jgi:uncharacterized UPF0160 family protein
MDPQNKRTVLVTHSGTFHADDTLAYAVLRPLFRGHRLVRSRDPDVISAGDVVWDVGSEYDPVRNRFDHHQRGAPVRPDGVPYSSAGLVWQSFGRRFLHEIIGLVNEDVEEVWRRVDDSVIRALDMIDNGIKEPEALSLAQRIDDMLPRWDEVASDSVLDHHFSLASEEASTFLQGRISSFSAALRARRAVRTADRPLPNVLRLPRPMPWQDAVFDVGMEVDFAIYPDVGSDNWMIACMPPEPGSYAQRIPLPADWAGLRGADLASVSGVGDAVFVHSKRFCGAARSEAGAIDMVRRTMELSQAIVPVP